MLEVRLMDRGRNRLQYVYVSILCTSLYSEEFNILTWLSKVAQRIVIHHPTVVSQEVTRLVWLIYQLHFLFQSHVLIWEGKIPARKRLKDSYQQ